MTETIKINLDRTYLFLRIVAIVAGAFIGCAAVYGNLDERMDNYEKARAVNENEIKNMNKDMVKIDGKLDKIIEYMVSSKPSSKE